MSAQVPIAEAAVAIVGLEKLAEVEADLQDEVDIARELCLPFRRDVAPLADCVGR